MKVAVLGSGNGACAVAADLALLGHEVSLFDFDSFTVNIDAINLQGGIYCKGKIEGFAKLKYAGHDIQKAIESAEFILAIGPAYSTSAFAQAVKPHIRSEQYICVCPSSCGGAIVFKRTLGYELEDKNMVVSETSTLPYACRCYEPGKVHIFHKLSGGVYFAALPAEYANDALNRFRLLYPNIVLAKSLLMTMLQTGNNIIHPAVTLLNASRIESTNGDFYFYEDGATPAAGKLMKALDDEKMQLSDKLDIGLIPDPTVKIQQGYCIEESYENGYRTAPGFRGIKAQSRLDHRYINEDVGYGLVFISELSKQAGLATPVIDSVILLFSTIMQRDYRKEGALTPKSLGIDKYSTEQLKSLFRQC